jgi:hypothetical protein
MAHPEIIAQLPNSPAAPRKCDGPEWADRSASWLPLIRRLTEKVPRWTLLKNVDSAFFECGDVDSMAPPQDWTAIEGVFREWAGQNGFDPVVVCRHRLSGPNFMTFEPGWPYVIQLDVMKARPFRGQSILDAAAALSLSFMDPRGFRCMRDGAQGLLKLCLNGSFRGGAANWKGLERKEVLASLRKDPEGVELAAKVMAPPEWALKALARSVLSGSWSRTAMLAIEASMLARGLGRPVRMGRQLFYRDKQRRGCPLKQLRQRRIPDRPGWIEDTMVAMHGPGHGRLSWPGRPL